MRGAGGEQRVWGVIVVAAITARRAWKQEARRFMYRNRRCGGAGADQGEPTVVLLMFFIIHKWPGSIKHFIRNCLRFCKIISTPPEIPVSP